jgi:hypothetical protein
VAYQWVACSLLSGNVIADLPGLEAQWPLRRTIGQADTATATLHLDQYTSDAWQAAVQEGGANLVCYDDAPGAGYPIVWAGYVVEATYDTTDDVQLSLATFEAVLDRVFLGDQTYTTSQKREDIIHQLIIGSPITLFTGITVNEQYTAGVGATPTDPIVIQNVDSTSLKAAMDNVCQLLGGEYTVEWSWINNMTGVVPTIVHAQRIGTAATPGIDPAVTFEMPGQITAFSLNRSYAPDKAGIVITAISSAQVDVTPVVSVTYPDGTRPQFEYRYSPGPYSATALLQYATQASRILGPGAITGTLTVSTARDVNRKLGVDWFLGDDIGYRVPPAYVNEQGQTVIMRAFPQGVQGVGRVIAYEFDPQSITPIFADKTVYVYQGT